MNKKNISDKTIIKTIYDSVNHTRFPKQDHLPYWARRDNKVTKGDRVEFVHAVLWYFFHNPYKQSGRWQDVLEWL
jgi:hypothetical protein